MDKRCEFKETPTSARCEAEPAWIADVGWVQGTGEAPSSDYAGTSWAVVLCDAHYQLLREAGRITGTAHPIDPGSG